jgi:copper chaperone CopZ
MRVFSYLVLIVFTGTMYASDLIKLKVDDIHCGGCLNMISQQLKKIKGIKKVSGDVKNKIITVTTENSKSILDSDLKKRVKDAGYTVSKIDRIINAKNKIKS